ncbi:MAG: hypothetical protein ACREBW_01280, partial [Candidatus Micrarchaeaceae archaeon]
VDYFSQLDTPFAIEPPEIDKRIIAQEGKFIVTVKSSHLASSGRLFLEVKNAQEKRVGMASDCRTAA